jgi:hypothetical protein
MARVDAKEYRDGLRRELDAREAFVKERFTGLTEEQINWKPTPDEWSIGQIFEHTLKGNLKYRAAIESALASAPPGENPRYSSGFMGRLLIRALKPGSNMYAPVPKVLEPTEGPFRPDIVQQFVGELEEAKALLQKSKGKDLAKAVFTSPFAKFVKVRVGDAFKVMEVHDYRHLQQAEAVMQRPGFPAAEPVTTWG